MIVVHRFDCISFSFYLTHSFLLSSGLDYEDEDEEEGDDSVFTSEEKAGECGKPTTGDATSELGKRNMCH